MLTLIAIALLTPPLIGLGLVGSARTAAMRDAQRLCHGYW